MQHYAEHFRGKVVYCNCDNPAKSDFWKFFVRVFNAWVLKKLIATHYELELVTTNFSYTLEAVFDENGGFGMKPVITLLLGNGDFRSAACIELPKEADIVVTNPPFSLFREYVQTLMAHGKKFIIVGNMNAITYKDFFPLIKNNEVWMGPSITSGDRKFNVPDDYPLKAAGCGIDEDGCKFIRVKGVRWFTNLDHTKRHEKLVLRRLYNPEEYLKYDNYDAINIDKVKDIPVDYDGVIGVPITFLDKYCPEQFEIVAFRKGNDGRDLVFTRNGVRVQPYFRILILHLCCV